ncbi:MAG: insulinase family protein [Chloroflexi bacterium]|nr:insulinase family protein [Chloroflexota bacterium]
MFERTVLPDGPRMISAELPGSRSVSVAAYVLAGSRGEVEGQVGVAHFLEHLTFKGTHAYPSTRALSEAIEGVGGSFNAATDRESTVYWARVPRREVARAVDVLGELICRPALDDAEIDRERDVIVEEIRGYLDDPAEYCQILFQRAMFGSGPLGREICGEEADIRGLAPARIREFWSSRYRPANAVVAIAGDIAHAEALGLVERAFGRGNGAVGGYEASPLLPAGERVLVGRRSTTQAQLSVGVPALPRDHPDAWALSVLNAALGDGMSSRLYLSLVDRDARGAGRDARRARPGSRAGQGEGLPVGRPGAADGRDPPPGFVGRRPGGAPRPGPDPGRGARGSGGGPGRRRAPPCRVALPGRVPAPRRGRPRALPARARRPPPAALVTGTPVARASAVEQRVAGIHLRLGAYLLARAELEQLAAADRLDVAGLADLAEVRWRTGDLDTAARAAAAHLEAGGGQPIARVVAAEAAAAAGRPGEAREHVAALADLTVEALERHFAGMPRRAFWPAAPAVAVEPLEAFGPGRGAKVRPPATAPQGAAEGAPDPRASLDGPGLWPDDVPPAPTGARPSGRTPAPSSSPADLLAQGRTDIRAGSPDRLSVGIERLALALRMDATLAPGVLEALGRRHEPAALVLRGDACRILGRVLDAEAAYTAAAAALEEPAHRRRD